MQVLCTAHRRRRHVVLSCNSPSSIVVLARLSLKFKSRSTRSANMFQNSCPVNWKSWNDPPAFVSHGQLPHKARIEQKAFMQWRASPPNELTFLGFSETRSTASMPLAHQSQCATTVCQREPRTLRPTCQCCQPPVALVDHSEMASPGSAQSVLCPQGQRARRNRAAECSMVGMADGCNSRQSGACMVVYT